MPRRARSIVGGLAYHLLNRANGRQRLFRKEADFAAFEAVLEEAWQRLPLRVLGYCVMPNHWHFVVWPKSGEERGVSEFFRWLTVTHTQRWHAHRGTSGTGHVYEGRFKSFPIESDEHLLSVLRYVERNAPRAKLVGRAEAWRWGSLWRRTAGDDEQRRLLSALPMRPPRNWTAHVNQPQTAAERIALRDSVRKGQTYGGAAWSAKIAHELKLEHTFRSRGRRFKIPKQ